MTETTIYRKKIYPSKNTSLGGNTTGYPLSGFLAFHFTYPDLEYNDDITTWQYGTNTNTWKQGLQIIIKTGFADSGVAVPTSTTNLLGIDLAAAATASSMSFDLGTERATRYIAAQINAHQSQQLSTTGATKLLKARYVRMSSRPSWDTDAPVQISATQIVVKFTEHTLLGGRHFERGYPSDLPQLGTIVVLVSGTETTYNYTAINEYNQKGYAILTVSGLPSYSSTAVPTNWTTAKITGEPEKHTIVFSWNRNRTGEDGSTGAADSNTDIYWSPANMGPVVQGVGGVPLWRLIAKPMDGGNMALPSPNRVYRGGGGKAGVTEASGGGYCRFSIEGLNSCYSPPVPSPDYNITEATIEGIVEPGQAIVTNDDPLHIEPLEYGSTMRAKTSIVQYENGYTSNFNSVENTIGSSGNKLGNANVFHDDNTKNKGLRSSVSNLMYARPFRLTDTLNTNTVEDMLISNEEKVFDDIDVIDDQGNVLTLQGGSPFGTVIKDYAIITNRKRTDSTDEAFGPSSPNGLFEPNMQIQLPDDKEIPGEIFVRTGHDRVQAWSNKSWGMGGLSAPDPRPAGVPEESNEPSSFDTHDRMLVFHCKRIRHGYGEFVSGIKYNTESSFAVIPSGSTRFFTAHRASDHAERGAVLNQTTNGTLSTTKYPHHRIRFGRQGHSFVSPMGHRGTPMAHRRQLHRSFGSSYSLMFEAKTEHKHFGFGNGESSNSTTRFNLDTLETKGESGYTTNAGSFSGDGLPTTEHLVGSRLHNHKAHYSSIAPRTNLDYLIAPGQNHTKVAGSPEKVSQGTLVETAVSSVNRPTHLTLTDALSVTNRANTASEFMVNGFLLGNPSMIGGRPEPPTATYLTSTAGSVNQWSVRGANEGVLVPRSATELATTPPLILHDPDSLNMAAVPIYGGSSYTVSTHTDMGLMKDSDTNTGATPDAFLCTWLAEYSHPALLGTSREHYLTFRYRESGMPRATNYPATNGLFLRNYSNQSTAGLAVNAKPFEMLYVNQWRQNYGYNGLNAAGHGTIEGIRSAGAVLMGHTGLAEPEGTMQILDSVGNLFGTAAMRKTRGEGIGDGLDPNQDSARVTIDADSDGVATTKINYLVNPSTAINYSRHLPVRAWGARTTSDALDMLAGTPTETTASMESIFGKGRFDGGLHDTMNSTPDATTHGSQWMTPTAKATYATASTPIGFVFSGETVEANKFMGISKATNKPLSISDEPLGIGRKLKLETFGTTNPTALASGHWDLKEQEVRPSTLPISGTVLWVKAGDLGLKNGEAVTSWADATGNERTFTQGTASAQPTFVSSDADFNNHPVVHFDGGDELTTPFLAELNPNNMTVFVVSTVDTDNNAYQGIVQNSNGNTGWLLYAKMSGSDNFWQWRSGTGSAITIMSGPTDSVNPTKPSIVAMKISGSDGAGGGTTAKTLLINGTSVATSSDKFTKKTATSSTPGLGTVGSFKLTGQMAEVIMYDRALSSTETAQVEAYLSLKYNIELPTAHAYSQSALNMIPQNKGTDPYVDLVQFTGSPTFDQEESPNAFKQESHLGSFRLGSAGEHHTLKGSAFHQNAASVANHYGETHYPITGWGLKNTYAAAPIPLSEIADHRQIQSRGEPRLGMVIETENERNAAKRVDYQVTGTKSISLHSDLAIGQMFPVLPAWGNNTSRRFQGMTTGVRSNPAAGSLYTTPTVAMSHEYPYWSPDGNAAKGAITVSNDTVRVDAQTHGMDYWSVRGAADMPAWGGVYILRKTYLNRVEESLNNESVLDGALAQAHQPQRKYIDYVVRLVRPLKMYGWASNLQSDGWVLGANASTVNTGGLGFQPFTRDKRYGVFEINQDRALGSIDLLASSSGALKMEWPDANDQTAVWHLIPSANMLQHFKSDANRKQDGDFVAPVEARYSQSTVSGGNEVLYQSESSYEVDGTGNAGDYAKRDQEFKMQQQKTMLRDYPSVVALQTFTGGGATSRTYLLEQTVSLPSSGTLSVIGKTGKLTYTSVDGRLLKGVNNEITSYEHGDVLFLNDGTTTAQTIQNKRSFTPSLPTAPSFIDNALVLNKISDFTWRKYDYTNGKLTKTNLSYRGLLEYSPSDFIMGSQRPLRLSDGKGGGVVEEYVNSSVIQDNIGIENGKFPPYLIDSNEKLYRVSGVDAETGFISIRNIDGDFISKEIAIGDVLTGQYGFIGLRTSDAALNLLNDAAGNIAGFLPYPSSDIIKNQGAGMANEIGFGANPVLSLMKQHSGEYVARNVKGLNILEVIKSLTEMDGRQLVVEENGAMIYSRSTFRETNIRLGLDSGASDIQVSKMFDSPNQVVIVGDVVAENERIEVTVKDLEKMRTASGSSPNDNLVRVLKKEVPGLKTNKEALRIAKSLLSRSENGAPLITINGLLKASSIIPGDMVKIDLPTHGIRGTFAVFEATHYQSLGTTDLVIAQYEKGIEGLLSDIQVATGNKGNNKSKAKESSELNEIALSGSVKIIAVAKMYIRTNNKQNFIIGAKYDGGLGRIGVADNNKKAKPLGNSKSRFFEVK